MTDAPRERTEPGARHAASYREMVQSLRGQFILPSGGDIAGRHLLPEAGAPAEFVAQLSRMLEIWSAAPTHGPWHGAAPALVGAGPERDVARAAPAKLPLEGLPPDEVASRLVAALKGLPLWSHPLAQINVAPAPTIASQLAATLALLANPNLVSGANAGAVAAVEARVAAMTAELLGFDPAQAGGLFTFGGAGGIFYGLRLGLEKALPGSMDQGLRSNEAVVIASAHAHASVAKAAAWLGIGREQVVYAPPGAGAAAIEAVAPRDWPPAAHCRHRRHDGIDRRL